MAKATREAQQLYQAGEKKWGTDESKFNVILASRSHNQLNATFDEYVKVTTVVWLHDITSTCTCVQCTYKYADFCTCTKLD